MLMARLLVAAALGPCVADAGCLMLASHPDGAPLARLALPGNAAAFSITYVHSVTRTPVVERYHIDGNEIVQTGIEFEQHGPGLPTEADPGGTFAHRDGRFIVTMQRRFPAIVMQVHADQAPRLVADSRTRDLAQWGNRALALAATSGRCDSP